MEAETVKKKPKPPRHTDHVPPEIIARTASPDETPPVATRLATLATSSGWDVTVTYARGTLPTTSPHLVHSVAVRMRRGPQQAVAVWNAPATGHKVTWKFEVGARLGRWRCLFGSQEGAMPIKLGSAALKAYLTSDLPVRPQDLPIDIWAPSQASVDAMAVVGDVMEIFLVGA